MLTFYTDTFVLPLPETHRFPMRKYARLRERCVAEGLVTPENLVVPPAASDEQLLLAHTPEYLERVKSGTLNPREVGEIGFPWSPEMVERSRRSTGATIAALEAAFADGAAVSLAGGTHHAYADRGQGFCVFNDAVVAIRAWQAAGKIKRAVIIDTDVHQGNGTAKLCADDPTIFTFSIHGAKNFPFRKETSDLDLPLANETGDAEYLRQLDAGLEQAFAAGPFDAAVFVSGADPYEHDRLGKLKLTREGLAERDRRVFAACRRHQLPVAVVMGGGYCNDVESIVDIHLETIRQANDYSATWPTQLPRHFKNGEPNDEQRSKHPQGWAPSSEAGSR